MPARRVAAVLVGALLWGRGAAAPGADAPRDEAARLAKVHAIPEVPLAEGVRLGGLSDLTPERQSSAGRRFWTLTDRGPNGIVDVEGEKLRTIEAAAFTPTLVLVELPPPAGGSAEATIVRTIPLATPSGRPLSGRPPPGLRDDPIVDPRSRGPVAADPDGVDSEGVVEMADGTFWIAEEYGPSLVHVAASGRVIDRFFPTGAAPAGSVSPAHDPLPAHYAARRENRGFEALAAAPDAALLFVLLQSPLDHPAPKAAKKTGNVRLLVFDPARGLPVAEHVYRLGDPQDPDYLTRGAPPDDGKLCAMASIDPATLLVLEQSDGGLARLYAATLEAATDTLRPRASAAADGKTLEQVRDLAAAGIVPIHKRLVADLGELLPEIEAAVYGGPSPAGKLKLEGLAILDERTIVIVNDNDFGVHARKSGAAPRSCLFVIELATPLPGGVAVSPRAAQNADE